jgi:DNA-binding response OmpR family regulator
VYAETRSIDVRALIAVAEPRLAGLIGRGLKEEGYSAEMAVDGDAALDRLTEDPPFDLLILDAALPRRSGLDVLKILREDQIGTPALVLTNGDAPGDTVRALNLGADATLAKPFVFDEFLARARALLRRRSAHRSPFLQSGDLTLDPAAHRVTRSGRRIALTAREYAVLEYFLRNPGQVLTREMIAEHVWGPEYEAASNVVDVYVGYLRRKIDGNGGTRMVHTIRGVGYMVGRAR